MRVARRGRGDCSMFTYLLESHTTLKICMLYIRLLKSHCITCLPIKYKHFQKSRWINYRHIYSMHSYRLCMEMFPSQKKRAFAFKEIHSRTDYLNTLSL